MLDSRTLNATELVVIKKTTTTKRLILRLLALTVHVGILVAGTNLAEYAWRFWGGHY